MSHLKDIKGLSITLGVFILVDMLWIKSITSIYSEMIKNIQNRVMTFNTTGAVLAYLFVASGLYFLAIRDGYDCKKAIIYGLAVYGTYCWTASAIFSKWNFNLAVAETIWGGLISFVVAYIVSRII